MMSPILIPAFRYQNAKNLVLTYLQQWLPNWV